MPRKDRDIPTLQEIEKMLQIAKSSDYQDYLFLLLASRSGRRLNEILSTRVKDIDFEEGFIEMLVEKRGDNQTRPVPVNEDVLRELHKYIKMKNLKPDDLLFSKSPRQFQNICRRYARLAKLDKIINPHSFRDFLITHLVRIGWTYENIKKLTGHTDIEYIQSVYDRTEVYDVADDFRAVWVGKYASPKAMLQTILEEITSLRKEIEQLKN